VTITEEEEVAADIAVASNPPTKKNPTLSRRVLSKLIAND